jgi:hypothetical protein
MLLYDLLCHSPSPARSTGALLSAPTHRDRSRRPSAARRRFGVPAASSAPMPGAAPAYRDASAPLASSRERYGSVRYPASARPLAQDGMRRLLSRDSTRLSRRPPGCDWMMETHWIHWTPQARSHRCRRAARPREASCRVSSLPQSVVNKWGQAMLDAAGWKLNAYPQTDCAEWRDVSE